MIGKGVSEPKTLTTVMRTQLRTLCLTLRLKKGGVFTDGRIIPKMIVWK
jgi:hypothetical protein